MATGVSANKLELLRIAESMAREKGIEPELVFGAMDTTSVIRMISVINIIGMISI